MIRTLRAKHPDKGWDKELFIMFFIDDKSLAGPGSVLKRQYIHLFMK
jgi:hypothetical protein